jgi:hypothetical protein
MLVFFDSSVSSNTVELAIWKHEYGLKYCFQFPKQSALAEITKRLLTKSKKYNVELLKKTKTQVASKKQKWKPSLPIDKNDEENRPIIIAYGGANIRTLRGNVSPPAKLVKKAVFRFARQRNRYVPTYATIVNEYLTSQFSPCAIKEPLKIPRMLTVRKYIEFSNVQIVILDTTVTTWPAVTSVKCFCTWLKINIKSINISA